MAAATRRVPTRVAVYAGTFASQPVVFAHLIDAFPTLDLDAVEVICGTDPRARLAHVFAPDVARSVEDALGLATTCVLVFAEAIVEGTRLPDRTEHLACLGVHPGVRHVPAPDDGDG